MTDLPTELRDIKCVKDEAMCNNCKLRLKAADEIERLMQVVTAGRAANEWLFRARNDDGRAKVACDLNAALIGLDEETQDLTTTDSDE